MLVEVRGDGLEAVLPYQPQNRGRKGGALVREALLDQIRYYQCYW